MNKISKVFRPYVICYYILIVTGIVYVGYLFGLVHSYKISFKANDFLGYVIILFYYFILILSHYLFTHSRNSYALTGQVTIYCKNDKLIYYLSLLYILISVYGLYRITGTLRSMYGLIEMVRSSFTYNQMAFLDTGNGNTIMSVFCVVSLILLSTIHKRKSIKWWLCFIINVVVLFFYSTILSSRILLIQGLLFSIIVIFRKDYYNIVIRKKYIIVGITLGILFLVITSGFRDFGREGYQYTNSIMA